MDIRVLNYFLMVAREENITKAAQLLHVTQPTLSRQLIQLEEELGVQLFHRGKHSVRLTEDGMLLRRRVQEIVSLSEKTKLELQHKEEMPAGEISIGCGETRSMTLLSQSMMSFRQRYPLVRFSIYSAIADDIKERMEKGAAGLPVWHYFADGCHRHCPGNGLRLGRPGGDFPLETEVREVENIPSNLRQKIKGVKTIWTQRIFSRFSPGRKKRRLRPMPLS